MTRPARCEERFIHHGPTLDWITLCELPDGHDGPHALLECICYPGECDQNMCEPACPKCRGSDPLPLNKGFDSIRETL